MHTTPWARAISNTRLSGAPAPRWAYWPISWSHVPAAVMSKTVGGSPLRLQSVIPRTTTRAPFSLLVSYPAEHVRVGAPPTDHRQGSRRGEPYQLVQAYLPRGTFGVALRLADAIELLF